MIAPPPLPDEVRRIATLRELQVLDTPPEERFDRLTRLARRMFDVAIAHVTLIDENRQWFKSSAGVVATQTPRDVSFCGHAIASSSPMVVPDAQLDLRFHDNPSVLGEPRVRFYAGCPLSMPNGSRVGALCIADGRPREFSQEDIALLSDLARMAEQELGAVQLANMDELTGIPNRRAFMALTQQTLDQCRRLQIPASMLFLDLDGFKEINDHYGHSEGDRALRAFAQVLQENFRDADIVGRLGGDEFAVLLFNCSEEGAQQAVRRLQGRLDSYNHSAASDYDIHFSVGHVMANTSRRCVVEALLTEADARMYERKRLKKADFDFTVPAHRIE
jgi:diguanylate cyclase (GGDEF)-like protein